MDWETLQLIKALARKYDQKARGQPCKQGEAASRDGCIPKTKKPGAAPMKPKQGGGKDPYNEAAGTIRLPDQGGKPKRGADKRPGSYKPKGDPNGRSLDELSNYAAEGAYHTVSDREADEPLMTDADWDRAADEEGLEGEARDHFIAESKRHYRNELRKQDPPKPKAKPASALSPDEARQYGREWFDSLVPETRTFFLQRAGVSHPDELSPERLEKFGRMAWYTAHQ